MLRLALKRAGLWPAVFIITAIAIVASVAIAAFAYSVFLGTALPLHSLIISVVSPAVISPLISAVVLKFIVELDRAHERLRELSNLDHLTGAFNRKYFMERLHKEIERSNRYGSRLSVAFIDIDDFKRINDRHGHLGGDEVLKQFVSTCMAAMRQSDLFARFGGEEFAVLLPETGREEALQFLERLRLRVAQMRVDLPDGPVGITVSIGHTNLKGPASEVNSVLRDADAAMYRAKRGGKNQVVSQGDSGQSELALT
jgi:diguanylate cyclase (GGDEF)-like protein